jgi:hypothetical protein
MFNKPQITIQCTLPALKLFYVKEFAIEEKMTFR